MKAAVLYQPNSSLEIRDLTLDDPQSGEVLIQLKTSGVCHSDWHIISGDTQHVMPVVLGHEGAGIVHEVGPGVTRVKAGDHVVLSWAPSCGECFYCHHGQPQLCQTLVAPLWEGTLLDGTSRLSEAGETVYHLSGLATFAEQAVVPQESCIPIRKDVPFPAASVVGCAVTTGVGAAVNTVQVHPGDRVAVFGCGGVGLNILQGAELVGADIIIGIDKTPEKEGLARTFGATHFVTTAQDPVQTIQDLTDGRGADYTFEAVGIPALMESALKATRPGGTLVIAGIAPVGSSTNFPGAILARQEKSVVGSYYGSSDPQRDFPIILDLYMSGKLRLDELISGTYKLHEINRAFEDMLSGKIARGVIRFDD